MELLRPAGRGAKPGPVVTKIPGRVQGWGPGPQNSGLKFQGSRLSVQGSDFKVQGSGLGLRFQGSRLMVFKIHTSNKHFLCRFSCGVRASGLPILC